MNEALLNERITGAAMDRPVPPRPRRRAVVAVAIVVLVCFSLLVLWRAMPRGLRVPVADMRIATVERGTFRDDVVVRAAAAPLNSIMLDSVESGSVEEVIARDGAIVRQGELLFRLSNPQRRLELLARESERAQQISNLSNLRVALEAGRIEHRRRVSDLSYALLQAQKQHARNLALADRGFISPAALDDSADRLAQQKRALEDEKASGADEMAIKREAVMQMERAIAGLDAGLRVVNATVEALAVRAPAAGRLTDFHLQVGETVRPDQHIGRIDDPARFKLLAQIDEYYLSRVAVGRKGSVSVDGRDYAVEVSRIYPQIKDGHFAIELNFENATPAALNPGQSAETHITLGAAREALLLPYDAFIDDSGGAWVFVASRDSGGAERRVIRAGRRNSSQVEIVSGLAPGERVIVSSYAAYGKAERLQFEK